MDQKELLDLVSAVLDRIAQGEDAVTVIEETGVTVRVSEGRAALTEVELPECEEARRGQLIADMFLLRKDLPGYPDRYKSSTGNKTALGVFRTMKRLVEDGE